MLVLRRDSQPIHKGKIYAVGILGCLIALFLGAGCSKRDAVKQTIPATRWACDREADEAMKRNDYHEAIRLHQKMLENEPDNALVLYHLGYAYGQLGDHDREVWFYERAAVLGYTEGNIFFNLGMAYGELNRIDEAIESFQKALTLDPENADTHFGLGLAYQRNVVDCQAEGEFLKAI